MTTQTLERNSVLAEQQKAVEVEFENLHSLDYLYGLCVLSIVSTKGSREDHYAAARDREEELNEIMKWEKDYQAIKFTSEENGHWDTIFFGSSQQLEHYQAIDQQLN